MQAIRVKANQKARTFTIRRYDNGNLISKYRTLPMSKEEFEENECNTQEDWMQFMKSNDYFLIK